MSAIYTLNIIIYAKIKINMVQKRNSLEYSVCLTTVIKPVTSGQSQQAKITQ